MDSSGKNQDGGYVCIEYHNYNEGGVSFDYGERNNVRCLCSQGQGQSRALLRAFQPNVFLLKWAFNNMNILKLNYN